MIRIRTYFCTLLLWTALVDGLRAQNLVINGDFEFTTQCTNFNMRLQGMAVPWMSAIDFNQPYYYSSCGGSFWGIYGTPNNMHGSEAPHSGIAYTAIVSYSSIGEFRTYIQTQLLEPLVAGKTYAFSMYVSLADLSGYASNGLQVYFSNARVRPDNPTTYLDIDSRLKNIIPQITTPGIISNIFGWTLVTGTYLAAGGEQWINIGNFTPNPGTSNIATPPAANKNNHAIYYIDDVSVVGDCDLPINVLGNDKTICGDSLTITKLDATALTATTYLWNTGATTPTININKSGLYWVKLMNNKCNRYDTINVLYKPISRVDLGPDTGLCVGQHITIGKNLGSIQYAWDDNFVIGPFRTISQSGSYWIMTINDGCRWIDTIVVSYANKPPVDLGSDRILCKNQTLTLSSSFPDSTYKWNTGNTTATIATDTPGTFWLEVNNKGCKNRDSIMVSRTALNNFSLGPDSLICKGHPTRLIADSAQATSYIWVNGATSSSIITDTGGIFWVDASLGSCVQRDSVTITGKDGPALNLDPTLYTCNAQGLLVNAQNPGATYLWSTGSNAQQVLLSVADIYWVNVTKNGCSVADTFQLSQQTPPVFDLGPNPFVCSDSSILLNAFVIGSSYKWQDGSTLSTFNTTGAGKYKVEVTKGACTVADSVQVFTFPKPTFTLGADKDECLISPLTLTAPTADSYLWQDGSTSNAFSTTQAGTYWVRIKRSVCNAYDTIVIGKLPVPVVDIGADKKLCKETPYNLTAQNTGSSYKWNNDSTSQTITVYAPGTFWVTVTNSNLCSVTDSIVLDTFPSPVVDLGKDTFTCRDSYFVLNAGPGFVGYKWNTGSSSSFIQTRDNGNYVVTVTDTNTCTATDTIQLDVKEKPVLKMAHLMKICDPDTLIYPGAFKQYLWQDGSTDTAFRAKHYGVYTVEVTDSNLCSNTDSSKIYNKCPGMLYVPNAFTPNNDFTNEIFIPYYRNIQSAIFKVYDRWGQLLFETTDMKTGWTGMVNGSSLNVDVYMYMVTYTGMDDETHTKSGNVTLLK